MRQSRVAVAVHRIEPELGAGEEGGQDGGAALLGGPHQAGDAVLRAGIVHVSAQVEAVQHATPVVRAAGGQQAGVKVHAISM